MVVCEEALYRACNDASTGSREQLDTARAQSRHGLREVGIRDGVDGLGDGGEPDAVLESLRCLRATHHGGERRVSRELCIPAAWRGV